MNSTSVVASLAFAAGLAGAVQVAVQGRLGDRVGTLEALTCAVIIAAVTAFTLLIVARRSLDGLRAGFSAPKWMLVGGLMTIVIVSAITIAGPRIGIVATSAFLIVGQFALAALIDRFGWFGLEPIALSSPRILGLALLAAGAVLTLQR